MGEESKVSKLFFTTTSNGDSDREWQEINMINNTDTLPTNYEDSITEIYETPKSISFSYKIDKNTMKRFMKEFRLNHISKKRAKKLLMSRGWSRNEANKIIEDTIPRTQGNIDNYGVKLRKCNIKI